jgi:hypothetical protein
MLYRRACYHASSISWSLYFHTWLYFQWSANFFTFSRWCWLWVLVRSCIVTLTHPTSLAILSPALSPILQAVSRGQLWQSARSLLWKHFLVEWRNTGCSESTYSVPHRCQLQVRFAGRSFYLSLCYTFISIWHHGTCLVKEVLNGAKREMSSDSADIWPWLLSHGRSWSRVQKRETRSCARGRSRWFRMLWRNA